jgi:CDGSH iron-sulfur domain-containing protein 3
LSDEPAARIRVTDNGPLMVKGPVTLIDAEGRPYEGLRKTIFLCRCGHSQRKPFCDGSHARIGFVAPGRAPAAARN